MPLLPARTAAIAMLVVAGCAPLSVEVAERQCLLEARQVRNPFAGSELAMGYPGVKATLDVTVSSDYLNGRDPNDVFTACVMRKARVPPSRPVYDHPDWRG